MNAADEVSVTWPRTVKLTVPIEIGGQRTEELTFRRGRLGDMKGVKIGGTLEADSLLLVASRMCGQPLAVLERLDADDAGEVMQLVIGFFGKCLATGSVPSPS